MRARYLSSLPSHRSPLTLAILGAFLVSHPLQVLAAPDAGSLLRDQPKAPIVVPAQGPLVVPAVTAPEDKDAGPKILVKGFHIQGAILISEAELVDQLKDVIGKELSFRQLQRTTTILTAYYAKKDFLARVVLLPQDIKDGIVTIQIVEGRRGSVNINSAGSRIDAARVGRFIDNYLAAGEVMNTAKLGEVLNVLNKQPGLAVTSALSPGKGEGDINVKVNVTERPLIVYNVNVSNYGALSTGDLQSSASVTLNNPGGRLDSASVLASLSGGTDYVRGEYTVAVGDRGLRVGVNASNLRYHLIQSNFSALNATGTADTVGATLSYPLISRSATNLNLTGSYDEKHLLDNTTAGNTGDRYLNVANLGLSGYTMGSATSLLGSGMTSFGGSVSMGNSNQNNTSALATDTTTRKVQGDFAKLSYNAGYLRALNSKWNLNSTLRGQFANKNLDSSEQFVLGGPNGVRAYPVGEAAGDEAWLLNLNLSRLINSNITGNLFLDAGSVLLNRNTWSGWNSGNTALPNQYLLTGMGVSLDWRFNTHNLLSVSIASPLGNNPGRGSNGLNSDGSKIGPRGWLIYTAQF